MASLSFDSNPVLLRELRAQPAQRARLWSARALRRAFGRRGHRQLSPGDTSIDLQSDGGARGQALFYWLFGSQIALVLAILPALATGALAQERERQTLQPLVLTPLSPLQIVWGKAGGVLSLVGLMLLATLPLTSLCFLLGGVDTGMLVAAYATILGLAVFTTGFGLYCSARWQSATRALMSCYALLAHRYRARRGGAAAGRAVFGFVLFVSALLRLGSGAAKRQGGAFGQTVWAGLRQRQLRGGAFDRGAVCCG